MAAIQTAGKALRNNSAMERGARQQNVLKDESRNLKIYIQNVRKNVRESDLHIQASEEPD
jgi:hypothetical protein